MLFSPITLLIRLMGLRYALATIVIIDIVFYACSIFLASSVYIHILFFWAVYSGLAVACNTLADVGVLNRLLTGNEQISHEVLERDFRGLLIGSSHSFLVMSRDEVRKDQGFNDAASEISYSAGELQDKSRELAENINRQSESTRSVAAAVTEISYSIEEISKRIHDAYQSANEVNELSSKGAGEVHQARANIEDVAEFARSTYAQLEMLAKHTQQVSSMSTVIREMAEQTNLLALNAAIEAARAGEHGRGFAVVADEVRALANRSHASAKDINSIIDDVQAQVRAVSSGMENVVGRTTESVAKANEAEEILQSIKQCSVAVADMLYAISSATEQQNGAAREISSNIEAVAAIADGNNDIARQSATIAEHLCHLCEIQAE